MNSTSLRMGAKRRKMEAAAVRRYTARHEACGKMAIVPLAQCIKGAAGKLISAQETDCGRVYEAIIQVRKTAQFGPMLEAGWSVRPML